MNADQHAKRNQSSGADIRKEVQNSDAKPRLEKTENSSSASPMNQSPISAQTRWFAEIVLIAALYMICGKLGFLLSMPPGNVTTIWAPSGIALAAILLRGYQVWPGIFLGSFLVNAWFFSRLPSTSFGDFILTFNIAAGSSVQAIVAAYLIERWAGTKMPFDRIDNVFKFLAVVFVACFTAPGFGVTSMYLADYVPGSKYLTTYATWWLGDFTGVVVVAPFLIFFSRWPWRGWTRYRVEEAIFLVGLLLLFCRVVFGGYLGLAQAHAPIAFVLIPFVVWSALRFGRRGLMLTCMIICAMAIWGTINGLGPFFRENRDESLFLLGSYMAITTLTGLALAAAARETRHAQNELRSLNARKGAILDVSLDCIITADHEGRIVDFNPAAERTFGYLRQEVIGRELAETIVPPSLRERHREGMARFLKSGVGPMVGKRIEVTGMRADGAEFPVELAIHVVELHGQPMFTAYVRDITEQKKREEAQSTLVAIVQSSDDAIIGKTLEGNIVSWNGGAERMYGYSAGEMVGKSVLTMIPPELPEEFPKLMERLKNGDRIERYETVRIRKDGTPIRVSLTVSPIKDSEGRLVGAATIARNITERKLAEEALRSSEERFRAFMNNSPAIAFIKDVAGRYIYINKMFEQLFGRTLADLSGKTDYDVWPAETAKQLRDNDVAVLNANKTIQMIEAIPTPDGLPHHWMVYKFPIPDVGGQRLLGAVAVDVTERRKLEAAREQLRVQYEEAMEKIKVLAGFIPICASCKKIRDDKGYWQQVEDYISEHSQAEFSHGLCPDCASKLYPGFEKPKGPGRL